ncbi:MAG: helix-turn-helix domain-containing protein [Deltaproteobacteria bacterium]|jgi:transcriptional regulator with XRE-family HTH domain|nr:helix-turn-helix domain-containing protein [Deltaproteobacteria bacterium]MDL1988619.1 helix-turn-helix domain-containing protein [Deltaproteobacteria bacterium]
MVKELPHKNNTKEVQQNNPKEGGTMFGEFIKTLRLDRDIGLREFCRQLSIDASNWSKIERGILPPPQGDEKLDQIAEVLGIKKISELYNELKDKAAIDAGIIPKDILSDQETLNLLPMFFRTVRSEKPTAEEIEKLIEKIRGKG